LTAFLVISEYLHTYFILTAGSIIAKVGAGVRDNTHAIMEFRIETSENKNSLNSETESL